MKLTGNKMTRRMTLLLAAVFSWLFVGSLIMFHQEHVMGKHTNAFSHHYIVPKSKDKAGYYMKQVTSLHKVKVFSAEAVSGNGYDVPMLPWGMEKLVISPAGLFSDHPPRMIHGLRAPPLA